MVKTICVECCQASIPRSAYIPIIILGGGGVDHFMHEKPDNVRRDGWITIFSKLLSHRPFGDSIPLHSLQCHRTSRAITHEVYRVLHSHRLSPDKGQRLL